ncbi:MAG: ATP-binding protein [Bacteroidaceae bacterium]|nr:ATP-binding protein [Bacteroidaceae bacterium]MBR6844400.1 ATP-binding protein [Bacteroidales bacterium]
MKKLPLNPFICQGYESPKYFCDRDKETKLMISTLYNGRNITLISPRRLGKTGLIWNTFHQIQSENKDAICIYIDIFPTKNQNELVNMLGSAVFNAAISKGKVFGRKIIDVLGALRPVVGIDSLTGMPNVTVNIDPAQSEMSIKSIFNHLNRIEKEVFIAIDEFQQITNYPETGTEAMLRSHIQFLHNIHFIFSGSKQHLMSEMFMSPQRPFYQSTDIMNLLPLNENVYYEFANGFFKDNGGVLNEEVFHELYNTFDGYTWYIQSILNRLYENYRKVESIEQLRGTILFVTESKSPQYESLTQLITENQFALLKAIAKEGIVTEPTGKDFLKKYRLSSASSIKTALESLSDKELIYRQSNGYIVYDRFLGIWLSRL